MSAIPLNAKTSLWREVPRRLAEQAEKLCDAFQKFGFDNWFQQQLGWQPPQEEEQAMTPAEAFARQAQIMLDHERRIKQQEQAQHNNLVVQEGHHQIIASLAGRVEKLSEGYVYLMERHANRANMLFGSHLSEDEATPLTLRKIVWDLINKYCYVKDVEHKDGRNYFYNQLKLRNSFDARTRARNKGIRPIEAVEQEPGMMERLYAIVSEAIRKEIEKKPELEAFFNEFKDNLLDAEPKEFVLLESNSPQIKELAKKSQLGYEEQNQQFFKIE